ncbi:MAG: sigma-70 family RNA polymerase sigma factor [Planctomycetaceae bacterium]
MSRTDQELIHATLSGQTDAYGELVLRYQDRLFNGLLRIVKTREDARDAAQDAFLQAYQKLEGFRGDSQFYSWLFRIAMNAGLSKLRRKSSKDVSLTAQQEQGHDVTDDAMPDPSHRMNQSEQQNVVLDALNSMADDYRVVLTLKELEGLKYEEIAEIVGCPIGTVRSRIHRARVELKEKLRDIL